MTKLLSWLHPAFYLRLIFYRSERNFDVFCLLFRVIKYHFSRKLKWFMVHSFYLTKHLRFKSCYFKQLTKILYFRRGDVVCLQALENSILSYPLPLKNLLPISNLNLIFRLNNHFKISELRFKLSKNRTKSDIFLSKRRTLVKFQNFFPWMFFVAEVDYLI